jgi:hypothetical protein
MIEICADEHLTPYMPITSDGKEPDLLPFREKAADARAVPAHHEPVAVMLDFVDLDRASRCRAPIIDARMLNAVAAAGCAADRRLSSTKLSIVDR